MYKTHMITHQHKMAFRRYAPKIMACIALIGIIIIGMYSCKSDNAVHEVGRQDFVRDILNWKGFGKSDSEIPVYDIVHFEKQGHIHPKVFIEVLATPEMMEQFKMSFITPIENGTVNTATQPTIKDLIIGPEGAEQMRLLDPKRGLPAWWDIRTLPDAEILTVPWCSKTLVLSRKTGRVFLYKSGG